jgi:hypothetical protein
MTDRELFASRFGSESFRRWWALLAAAYAQPVDEREAECVARCTGGRQLPAAQVAELWIIVGRRGGKSMIAALLAIFMACFRTYRLAPGERGVVMVIAADRRQARVVKRYVAGLIRQLPMLADLIAKETTESLVLTNGVDIEIHTASFRAIRGYTVVGAICDEIAFWPSDDAAEPDTEILNALRPAMASVPDALLVAISSPYARRGELWRTYREHYGQPTPDILVWQADSRTMNPSLSEATIARAYERDEAAASAEYGAEFRRDIESFVRREVLDAATVSGRHELPPTSDAAYVAFVDPSGGAADSFTLALAHREQDGQTVLDVVREMRPPFSPEAVVADFAKLLQRYRVTRVVGDRYAGEWPREQFRKHAVEYDPSDRAKSDIYRDLLPLLNSGRLQLLDDPRLVGQLASLERRTARGGRDFIDHAPKAHDDLANAAAGALLLASIEAPPLICG